MTQYIAWPTGEQDIVRARIAAHRAADEIIQGAGWTCEGKGCAVGCSLDNYSHDEYSRVLGVDRRIALLVDRIHEALPLHLALDWPGRVAAALQPGADTTLLADRFSVWVLRQGVCGNNEHCARVASLYGRKMRGDMPTRNECRAASAAAVAYAAAADAAYYAAADAASYAASSAYADAAAAANAYAAANASYAAANAYAAAAARSARAAKQQFWSTASSVLIELIERLPRHQLPG